MAANRPSLEFLMDGQVLQPLTIQIYNDRAIRRVIIDRVGRIRMQHGSWGEEWSCVEKWTGIFSAGDFLLIAFLLMTAASFFSLYQHTEAIQAYREEKLSGRIFCFARNGFGRKQVLLMDSKFRQPMTVWKIMCNLQPGRVFQTRKEKIAKDSCGGFWESHKNSWQIGLVKFVNQRGWTLQIHAKSGFCLMELLLSLPLTALLLTVFASTFCFFFGNIYAQSVTGNCLKKCSFSTECILRDLCYAEKTEIFLMAYISGRAGAVPA